VRRLLATGVKPNEAKDDLTAITGCQGWTPLHFAARLCATQTAEVLITHGACPNTRDSLGQAVQVDPIRPTLKAPAIKLLELKYGKPLPKCAFKFNLRHYIWGTPRCLRRAPAATRTWCGCC